MLLIDLTRKIEPGMPVYPGDPLFQSREIANHDLDGFHTSCWSLGSHLGTHLDAPFHFFSDGESLEDLTLDWFFGDAALLDLTSFLKDAPPPFEIQTSHLEPFEAILEKVPRILLKTGWESFWKKPDFYETFPSISPETAEWLADFPLRILGLETPSLSSLILPEEKAESATSFCVDEVTLHADAESHRIFLGRRPPLLLLEGLTNLKALPAFEPCGTVPIPFDPSKIWTLNCFPLPIEHSDGCPVRAVAIVAQPDQPVP